MINVIACAQCGTPSSSGDNLHKLQGKDGFVCHECLTGKKQEVKIKKAPKHKWQRWICKTHDCGSYNFGNLVRHEMPWCEIVYESSVMLKKPKTFGGMNGDVGRHHFKDWQSFCVEKERRDHLVTSYNKWSNKKSRRRKHAYRSR
mgnify:CR=1 FL=1|tara:strand:- start:43300 stop:43734 length:435 start_codon:yes stop_codon:yes gene_type:complete